MLNLGARESMAMHAFLREAAGLARRIQSGMALMGLTKSDFSPVTVADFAIQALAGKRLGEAFPGMVLLAEEESKELAAPEGEKVLEVVVHFLTKMLDDATGARVCAWIDQGASDSGDCFWTLDPIDGTKGYRRGGQYAVALALVDRGRVLLGGLACPNLAADCRPATLGEGVVAMAAPGAGAWRAEIDDIEAPWTALEVSRCADPARARMLRSVESAHTNTAHTEGIAHAVGLRAEPVLMDSQAKCVTLAAGHGEILLRLPPADNPGYREKIWDNAAGAILIEEAGGRVSDMFGAPLDFSTGRRLTANRGLVATNGLLHDAVIQAVVNVVG